MKFSSILLASLVTVSFAQKDKDQKHKDKRSRLLRNLRKEASVRLDDDSKVAFNDDSIGMQCLTSSTPEYKNLGKLSKKQARIFICQNWLNEMQKLDRFLNENYGLNLLDEDDYDYAETNQMVLNDGWGLHEGPNAKNTVIAFKRICDDIIPADHPPFGFNCRGGYTTASGEELSHSECRERYDRQDIKRSKKVCRREIKNRAGNKGKWL